jgi:hypothetical protein
LGFVTFGFRISYPFIFHNFKVHLHSGDRTTGGFDFLITLRYISIQAIEKRAVLAFKSVKTTLVLPTETDHGATRKPRAVEPKGILIDINTSKTYILYALLNIKRLFMIEFRNNIKRVSILSETCAKMN